MCKLWWWLCSLCVCACVYVRVIWQVEYTGREAKTQTWSGRTSGPCLGHHLGLQVSWGSSSQRCRKGALCSCQHRLPLHGGHSPSVQQEDEEVFFSPKNKVIVNLWQTRTIVSCSSVSPFSQPLPTATHAHVRENNFDLISCSNM